MAICLAMGVQLIADSPNVSIWLQLVRLQSSLTVNLL